MPPSPLGTPLGTRPLLPAATDLLALLDVSLTALALLRPLYAAGNAELMDFAFDYLNPAGQRMLGLIEQPTETFLTRFPSARETGAFAFCRSVFETGEPGGFEVSYPADGVDHYVYAAARRQDQRLAVSFTGPADHDRAPTEIALRESQAAEATARAAAESQRQHFYDVLVELPAQVATYRGPDHVFAFVNPRYQRYFPGQVLLGRSLRDVLPEAGEQGIFDLLDRVQQTGEPYHGQEVEVWLDFARTGQREQVFLDLFFYPLRDAQGRVSGVLDFSYDVTRQVRARQQVQALNQELRTLNEELEQRVEARTAALRAQADAARHARTDAEQARASLERFLSQTKAAIGILRGPDHRIEYLNPAYRRLFAGRELPLGRPVAEAHPAAVAQGLVALLDGVYRTGESYFGTELPLSLMPVVGQPAQARYFTFSYDAYQEQGQTAGVSVFAYDVTESVLARRQNEALQAEALAAAERQLREREAFYQVFAQTPAAVALLRGPEHRFEYLNPAYQRLFPGHALAGRALAEALPEAAAQGFVALLDGVYRSGEPFFGYEMPLALAAAGEAQTRHYTFTYQRYEEDGQSAGISIFAYDVTEQVLARQERETQQQRLHDLFEQAPVSIAVLRGPRYVFELANPLTSQLLGRPAAELLGRGLFEAVPETAGLGFEELLDGVLRTGVPYVAHESPSQIERDGRVEAMYWNYLYHPLREPDGRITGIITVATDATAQVLARQRNDALQADLLAAAQRQVQEREAFYQVFALTPAAVALLREPNHRYAYCNAAYQRLFPGQLLLGRLAAEAHGRGAGRGRAARRRVPDGRDLLRHRRAGAARLARRPAPAAVLFQLYLPAVRGKWPARRHFHLRLRRDRAGARPPAGAGAKPGVANHQPGPDRHQPAAYPHQRRPRQLHLHGLPRPENPRRQH